MSTRLLIYETITLASATVLFRRYRSYLIPNFTIVTAFDLKSVAMNFASCCPPQARLFLLRQNIEFP